MALTVMTKDPRGLIADVRAAMKCGTVKSWSVDADGDFTMTTDVFKLKAWLRPSLREDRIVLNVLTQRGTTMSRRIYAVYHARFAEMLLEHFDTRFETVRASALALSGDIVKA